MSVRATERLIGDIVRVTELAKSPAMVVTSVEIEKKAVFTSWFSDSNEYQEGCFPASSLDRVEKAAKAASASRGTSRAKPQNKTRQAPNKSKAKAKKR